MAPAIAGATIARRENFGTALDHIERTGRPRRYHDYPIDAHFAAPVPGRGAPPGGRLARLPGLLPGSDPGLVPESRPRPTYRRGPDPGDPDQAARCPAATRA